jgi:hypothetical protein
MTVATAGTIGAAAAAGCAADMVREGEKDTHNLRAQRKAEGIRQPGELQTVNLS